MSLHDDNYTSLRLMNNCHDRVSVLSILFVFDNIQFPNTASNHKLFRQTCSEHCTNTESAHLLKPTNSMHN